jgi:aldehyde dehydrogenase (NAD+)
MNATLTQTLLRTLGVDLAHFAGHDILARSPIDGQQLASIRAHSAAEVADAVSRAEDAFLIWRNVPAPRRGELVRLLGEELRTHKSALGQLVTIRFGRGSGDDRHL